MRYLVENSLGRLWLLNRPGSKLAERMEYYIAPEEPETDFLKITTPEEIRICDPACGSGHMLTYAFDLLYAIYEEEGFDPVQIPELILKNNLTGIEIDDRAGALAAFALAMKAAAKLGRRRFLRMEVRPDVVVLENVEFTGQDRIGEFLRMIGQGSNMALADTLAQFGQAKNFGSLIVPKLKNPGEVLEALRAKDFGGDILLEGVRDRVVTVLRMAEALAPRYHVVVANPPYMGGKGMNGPLGDFAKANYPDSKSDLFAMFIERGFKLIPKFGYSAMVTMQSWMFLSSYEKLRSKLIDISSIDALVHMGNMVMGIAFGTSGTVWKHHGSRKTRGAFCYVDYDDLSDAGVPSNFPPINERNSTANANEYFHRASAQDFGKIEGSPVAYWASDKVFYIFDKARPLKDVAEVKHGLSTGKNEEVVRFWAEVSYSEFGRGYSSRIEALESKNKWFPYNKGGEFRRWYGNCEFVLRYDDYGNRLMESFSGHRHDGKSHYFKEGVTWTFVTSGNFAARYTPHGFVFDVGGSSLFPRSALATTGFLCSKLAYTFLKMLNPTLNFQVGNLKSLPFWSESFASQSQRIEVEVSNIINAYKSDWDSFETSWDFTTLPLLSPDHRSGTLEATYARLRAHWAGMTAEMQRLEEENNRIFIDAYGLQDELTPEVPIEEITLTCNPAYRYGVKGSEEEREARLLADTMKELISYAIGCMFGRYSLDAPGLILANQGDTVQTYLDRIPDPRFMPDRDNVIPLFEEDWFEDDAYQRFREFLSLTFGPDRLVENLEFMRSALGKEVRAYLAKDFYADHVQRYKKRPIYWLVSSPKGAFQALIYMHRYTPDTLNITLNDYVRGLRDRLEAGMRAAKALEISPDASAAEKNRAKRDIDRFTKQIAEVTEWERDILYPLAVERIRIDLDDGVKRNYPLFPGVLKPIKGLEGDDDA